MVFCAPPSPHLSPPCSCRHALLLFAPVTPQALFEVVEEPLLILPSFHVLPPCSSRFLAVCHVCHTTAQRKRDPLPPPATESAFSTQFQFLKRVDTVVKCVRSVCGVCAMADGGGDDAAGGDGSGSGSESSVLSCRTPR